MIQSAQKQGQPILAVWSPSSIQVNVLDLNFRVQGRRDAPHALHTIDVGARMIAGVDSIAERLEQESQRAIPSTQIEQRPGSSQLGQRETGLPAKPLQGKQIGE